MMRGKPANAMQKTYDDCYLICSTAVYFESQSNETEALRSWRSALDAIYYHNAYRMPSGWRARTETEKALHESLKQMEIQCRERVDLLEALKESREERKSSSNTDLSAQARASTTSLPTINQQEPPAEQASTSNHWMGGGTVPPMDYDRIARPQPPTLPARPPPKRPSYPSKDSFESARPKAASTPEPSNRLSPNTAATNLQSMNATRSSSRTPSPEKKTSGMLRTLRAPGKDRSSSRNMPSSLRKPPAASKAATQAWGASTTRLSVGSSEQTNGDGIISQGAMLSDRPPSRDRPTTPRTYSDMPMRPAYSSDLLSIQPEENQRRRSSDNPPPALPPYADNYNPRTNQSSNSMEKSLPLPPYPMDSFTTDTSTSAPPPPLPPPHTTAGSVSNRITSDPTSTTSSRPVRTEVSMPAYRREYPPAQASKYKSPPNAAPPRRHAPAARVKSPEGHYQSPSAGSSRTGPEIPRKAVGVVAAAMERKRLDEGAGRSAPGEESSSGLEATPIRRRRKDKEVLSAANIPPQSLPSPAETDSDADPDAMPTTNEGWQRKVKQLLKNLPKGVDEAAAKQILNEIVIKGDEVHWDDVAGLDVAKSALKETVVYPFLRPDLFMGLREPARGMLLFGPPGTGKTMLARAVATESRSTFFAISASSLTSKFLGESEKLVRALFALAKLLAPSIIFVDEIDSLLSSRGGSSEHEATRRIKTEFLIQWSDLQKAAAGREQSERDKERGDAMRVLVLAATNLPWAIDEAARRRFVRRQYIPLPEDWVRKQQLGRLLGHQKQSIGDKELDKLVKLTDGFSGSDITALAKDAAMGPLRSLGEKLLDMKPEDIRPISFIDFQASLINIRPSVSKAGLKEFEDWAKEFGERGG